MSFIKPSEIADETPASEEFEGEIREFIRKDVAPWRKRPDSTAERVAERISDRVPDQSAEPASDNVGALVQRVAGASLSEIDSVIDELRNMREFLRNEGERVQREIAGYATLSQTAATSIKTITDSMADWRRTVALPPSLR